jgi:hypothetical protein
MPEWLGPVLSWAAFLFFVLGAVGGWIVLWHVIPDLWTDWKTRRRRSVFDRPYDGDPGGY